ncbi:MAG: preprotein translocase subunit SecA [Halobacteriovoraceae bacterium]|nr:preprotein translocase subunit SecA [Halobacteriovoraceae bacterium]|tara:strand:- start:1193 stop:3742 length:2550 start_codon:yes stop_codon:yes gene_type:complete
MLNDVLKKVFGTKQSRDMKALKPLLKEINALEEQMKKLSDDELKAQTPKFRELLANGSTLTDILPEAFATVREASVRVLKMRPFDVQIMGGIVLSEGKIAEMKTGEGKTLTAALPMYIHGLTQKGAHLVTVNDYLAARDAKDMGELYEWLGLTVGCIVHDMDDDKRQEAYNCDITYGTNNEFAFDYLRDNMKFDLGDYVQRDHNFCIVDEVDSILIDEARTPLLISGPSEGNSELYVQMNRVIPKLEAEKDYTVEEKTHTAVLTDDGVVKVQEIIGVDNLFDVANMDKLHHINQALRAHTLFEIDKQYVVKEGKVIIVDEFTGRLKEGSRWSDGLHQAIEAKEGVPIKSENQTLASITFQNYFKMYNKLAGMTGTADTEAEEFGKIYNLEVVVIPTNVPIARQDNPDVIYANKKGKYKAVAELIRDCNQKKQPVLVGTITIDESEIISNYLNKMGVKHEVLNAKQHQREADIVANAGQPGAVTIATNMAGRGTDIKLTEETKAAGGLYIIGTERHESRRIDNQLRGRSGRQGDPGASKFFLSLEDDLMRIFGSDRAKGLMEKMGLKEDEPIEAKILSNQIAKAQKRVEGHNFDIRKRLLDFDNVMNEQRKVIYRLRREILNDEGNRELIEEMIEDVSYHIIEGLKPEDKKAPLNEWDWEAINNGTSAVFATDLNLSVAECSKDYASNLEKYIISKAKGAIEEKFAKYDREQVVITMREVLLSTFDQFWKDHLLNMDHLKEGIYLRQHAQKDPLVEYKREAFHLFEAMKEQVRRAVVERIYSVRLYTQEEIEEIKKEQQKRLEEQLEAHKRAQAAAEAAAKPIQRKQVKVGRNDPCPCGSGKKFKHCHGA